MSHLEDLSHDAIASGVRLAAARYRMQLRVDLRKNLYDAVRLHCGVALHPKRRQQNLVGQFFRNRGLGRNAQGAANARVDKKVLPCDLADRADHCVDFRVDEVQRYGLALCGNGRRDVRCERGGNHQAGEAAPGKVRVDHGFG